MTKKQAEGILIKWLMEITFVSPVPQLLLIMCALALGAVEILLTCIIRGLIYEGGAPNT